MFVVRHVWLVAVIGIGVIYDAWLIGAVVGLFLYRLARPLGYLRPAALTWRLNDVTLERHPGPSDEDRKAQEASAVTPM